MTASVNFPANDGEPVFETVLVTPELAQLWLSHNLNNRPTKPGAIEGYARDMTAGNWPFNGETIKRDWNGNLLDGQNRLWAVIKANVPVKMLVVSNLPPNSADTVDSGIVRSVRDILRRRGMKGPVGTKASTARGLLMLAREYRPTRQEQVRFVEENEKALDEAAHWAGVIDRAQLEGGQRLYGVAYYQLAEIDAAMTEQFFEQLASGAIGDPNSPVLAVRNLLMHATPSTARDEHALRFNIAHLFIAWNAWRQGEPMRTVRYRSEEPFPFPK